MNHYGFLNLIILTNQWVKEHDRCWKEIKRCVRKGIVQEHQRYSSDILGFHLRYREEFHSYLFQSTINVRYIQDVYYHHERRVKYMDTLTQNRKSTIHSGIRKMFLLISRILIPLTIGRRSINFRPPLQLFNWPEDLCSCLMRYGLNYCCHSNFPIDVIPFYRYSI